MQKLRTGAFPHCPRGLLQHFIHIAGLLFIPSNINLAVNDLACNSALPQ